MEIDNCVLRFEASTTANNRLFAFLSVKSLEHWQLSIGWWKTTFLGFSISIVAAHQSWNENKLSNFYKKKWLKMSDMIHDGGKRHKASKALLWLYSLITWKGVIGDSQTMVADRRNQLPLLKIFLMKFPTVQANINSIVVIFNFARARIYNGILWHLITRHEPFRNIKQNEKFDTFWSIEIEMSEFCLPVYQNLHLREPSP
jgi:hypothetical protein